MKKNKDQRLWQVDFIRAIAVILMILFHSIFNLRYFFNFTNINFQTGFWYYEGRLAASLFMISAGIVSVILYKKNNTRIPWKKYIKRSTHLLGIALLITGVSYIFDPIRTIHFGILHFLSVGIFLSAFFVKYKDINLLFASIFILLHYTLLPFQQIQSFLLLPLGIKPQFYQSFDYYPLIPWMSMICIGIFIGHIFYEKFQNNRQLPKNKLMHVILFLGKHSLTIYLIHQPILLLFLSIIFM